MKARIAGVVVAEAPESELVRIEGNWYFPPAAVVEGVLSPSETRYHCPWKGDAQYWDVRAGGETLADGAWSYPEPIPTAFDRVGADFSGYLAFDRRVTVGE